MTNTSLTCVALWEHYFCQRYFKCITSKATDITRKRNQEGILDVVINSSKQKPLQASSDRFNFKIKMKIHDRGWWMQWRIQDFPEEGALTQRGAPTYYLANFCRKLHENEEILGRGGTRDACPPLDPPLECLLWRKCLVQKTSHFSQDTRWIQDTRCKLCAKDKLKVTISLDNQQSR